MARATIAVIGAGTWGISLAAAAARAGAPTLLYSRRARRVPLPAGVVPVETFYEVGERARLIILAVPSQVARSVARELGDAVDGRHLIVHGVRGLAGEAMESISEIVRQETPARRLGALGGPVLAEELAAGTPSVMVCGSPFAEVNEAVTDAFSSETLRVSSTLDLRGLEWASSLVGCMAIAVGYAQQAGLGPGLVASITTRAVWEAARIVHAAGGEEKTMFGLAGYGDLLACISQVDRPEKLLGAALAKGMSLDEAVVAAKLRVEAVELLPLILRWAHGHKVRAPVLTALSRGLFASPTPELVVQEIMMAPLEAGA